MIPHYGHEQQLVVFIEEHGVTRTTRFPHSHNLDDYGFIPSTPAHMGTHPEGKVTCGSRQIASPLPYLDRRFFSKGLLAAFFFRAPGVPMGTTFAASACFFIR